ncbi:fibronectin type III domain-containing protein [Candidatus Rariloculus sp.]|uniref:fibronectin type III domain-containing protein n=1 Tax=Candidatus Rariloculus sp. TaxID=3101265 RepID=UPI003D0BE381
MRPGNRFVFAILGRESRGVVASLFAFGLLAAALLACAAPAAAQNTVPEAELDVKAEPGDEKVSLHFKEPDDGGSPITRYEYRVKVATGSYPATWTRVPEFTGNVGATLDLFVVVESLAGGTALANGTEYAFQVRAVNGVGAGMPGDSWRGFWALHPPRAKWRCCWPKAGR